jgi:hypothetical protein
MSLYRTAVYGPVCPVVWEGWSREASPYPDRLLHTLASTERDKRIHHGDTENTENAEKEGGRFAPYIVASFGDVRVIPVDSVSSVPPW